MKRPLHKKRKQHMLIDTHCHINMMIKRDFDRPLTEAELLEARPIVDEAVEAGVTKILNVGTSLVESNNCIILSQRNSEVYAAIGIHPNDLTQHWKDDLKKLSSILDKKEELKIIGIGECGFDKHYPDYNILRQEDAFRAQIELALQHNLGLVVHTRDAPEETVRCLQEYRNQGLRGTIHCFSEDLSFAQHAIDMGFVLGIGGTITYPKNDRLRSVVSAVGLDHIILETDAPFLPPQIIRGKQNHPRSIRIIAQYIAELLTVSPEMVAQTTSQNAAKTFDFSRS